jgi:hypothetical protein
MVEEGKHEAAQDNLRLAQIQLSTYRTALGKEESDIVKALEEEITALTTKTENEGAAAKIRGFWERAVSLFQDEPGQAEVVEEGVEKAAQEGQKPNEQ